MHDETRMTAAETLKVVYGLVQEMSEQIQSSRHTLVVEYLCFQMERHPMTASGKPSVGTVSDNTPVSCLINCTSEMLHELASDMNKLKRRLFLNFATGDRKF